MEHGEIILTAVLGAITTLIPAILVHLREIKKINIKLKDTEDSLRRQVFATNTLDRWLNIHYIGAIKRAARKIINSTKADRFLIIIGFNGKERFRFISVIVEEHVDPDQYRAVDRYKKVVIDDQYVKMLYDAEHKGPQELNTKKMEPCKLRDFYEMEGVNHSIVTFLSRENVDENNDLVIFSSTATHGNTPFTQLNKTLIDTVHTGAIKEVLDKIQNSGRVLLGD